jgi:hypothetical protein
MHLAESTVWSLHTLPPVLVDHHGFAVTDTRVEGLKMVAMSNKPVNAMSMDFLNELSATITSLEVESCQICQSQP